MANLVDGSGSVDSNFAPGTGTQTAVFTLPGALQLNVESVVAHVNNASASAVQPKVTIKDPAGNVLATVTQARSIPAGDTGNASWSLRLGGSQEQSGIYFDTDNQGGYLDITANDTDPSGSGIALKDNSGGDLYLQNYGGGKINLDSHTSVQAYGLTDLLLQSGAGATVRAQNGDLFLIANGVGKNVQVRMDTGNSFFVLDFATAALYFGSGSWGTTAYLQVGASFKVENHLLATLFEITEAGGITFPGGGTVVPASPSDATKFLNGAASPAFALVKDSDLSTSDITTNNASTSKHGFTPKYPNDSTKYLDGTGAYSVPAGSGSGIGAVLFDSTLGSDTASIDTGAGGIAGGYHVIVAYMTLQTDTAAGLDTVDITINNDGGGNYDREFLQGNSTTTASGSSRAQTQWRVNAHGTGGTGAYAASQILTLPNYAGTTFNKQGTMVEAILDNTAGTCVSTCWAVGYRSTTAISRMKVAGVGAAKLKTGSRLTIIGW